MENRGRRTWVWALGLSVVLALVVGVASGKPPPPPSPDPVTGEIYYYDWVNPYLWVMDADGSGQTPLDDPKVTGAPSFDLHGGERWFLNVWGAEGTYPSGRPVWEVAVYNESRTVLILLTDDPLLEITPYPGQWEVTWASGDEAISWVAHSWVWDEAEQEYVVDQAGIWSVPVTFYMDGNQMKVRADGTPTLAVECDYTLDQDDHVFPDVGCSPHSWSPDNTQIVYVLIHWDKGGARSMHIKDITTGSTSDLGGGSHPKWSSADQIAYVASNSIYLINPDGSGQEVLVSGRRREPSESPSCSPDGDHGVYTKATFGNDGSLLSKTIHRVSVSTGKSTNLHTEGAAVAWR